MTAIAFEKFHGTGNDFILLDNREKKFRLNEDQIAKLCDRHFGIGADGLIMIQKSSSADFEMLYYNSDGRPASFCGNGGRCAVIFAEKIEMIKERTRFSAFDGIHDAILNGKGNVKLSMGNVGAVRTDKNDFILDTGSPHYVRFVSNVENVDVVTEGRQVRFNNEFKKDGINVNFVSASKNHLSMRTYERGVENETLSCGTGTVAVAIAYAFREKNFSALQEHQIKSPGGMLKVYFKRDGKTFKEVWLEGNVTFVFAGKIEI